VTVAFSGAEGLRSFASALLDGRDALTVLAGMSPQQPTASLRALVREAVERGVRLTVWVGDLSGRFAFLDDDAVLADGVSIGMYAGAAPARLAPSVLRLPGGLWDADRRIAAGDPAIDLCLVRADGGTDELELGNAVGLVPAALAAGAALAVELAPRRESAPGLSRGIPWSDVITWQDDESSLRATTPAAEDEVRTRIARQVVALLPRGPVLQVGIGSLAEQVIAQLGPDPVRFHSGTLPAPVRARLRDEPTPDGSHLATSLAPDAGPEPWPGSLRLAPVTVTHDPATLASLPRLWAVNSALTVDLTGAANAEWMSGARSICGGGQIDFARGATASAGGASVIALASRTSRGASRIVPALPSDEPATTTAEHISIVVTEHGVARLDGLDPEARALALVGVAHPDDRAELLRGLG
jgi:4-hydroxybutyrate CoA-transferase